MINSKIKKEVLKIVPNVDLKKKQKFITDGLLDSFNLLILVSNLEKEFKIRINLKNFDVKNLDSINSIENLIKKYKKNGR